MSFPKTSFLLLLLPVLLLSGPMPAEADDLKMSFPADRQICREMTDRAFTVRECLHLAPSTRTVAPVPTPEALEGLAGELMWAPSLLGEVVRWSEASGWYVRTAWVEGRATVLGSESFRWNGEGLTVTGRDGMRRTFSLVAPIAGVERAPAKQSLSQSSGGNYMGCYIDTPAYDEYQADFCGSFGSTPSQVSFKVFLSTTPDSVVWSQPTSSCSWLTCTVGISPGQTKHGYAYWVVDGTPTGPVSATARYLGPI